MSARFRQYLIDAYVGVGVNHSGRKKISRDLAIQIDDQDDNDILASFCTIFVTVGTKNGFEIELLGPMPITLEIADLAEIYGGSADAKKGRLSMKLTLLQIEAVSDLTVKIRKTAQLGPSVGNPHWDRTSARTISSLRRFVRVVHEYIRSRSKSMG